MPCVRNSSKVTSRTVCIRASLFGRRRLDAEHAVGHDCELLLPY
jgi:hypothetical protein